MRQADPIAAFRAGMAQTEAEAVRLASLGALRASGLVDAGFYAGRRGALPPDRDVVADWHDIGWRLGCWPNPYFDPDWYRGAYDDVAAAETDPLLHYVCYGEPEGRRPVAWFDPEWYRARYAVPAGCHALTHFLRNRTRGHAPIPEFDAEWYLATYPDVAAADMDPMEHYLVRGFREGRDPAPGFDTRYYRWRYLRDAPDAVPLVHYLRHRQGNTPATTMPAEEVTPAREVARFTRPGPLFEPLADPVACPPSVLALAFYLPQFHAIAENDGWWGEGFTEWTNLPRGQPRFAGHYQPRVPRDLGHYRADDAATLRAQADLAAGAGFGGFVFYYYRFGNKRLLERPLDLFAGPDGPDFPFCLMWANENWTRAWDGAETDVLMAQTHDAAEEPALVRDFLRYFASPRYIRLEGRPLLMVYRPGNLPEGGLARLRRSFARHGSTPIFVMAQSFGAEDPRGLGFDAAVGFPPHGLVNRASPINHRLALLDPEFSGQVYDYEELAAVAAAAPRPDYPYIPCVVPGWDNDARRPGRGMSLHGATPAAFAAWLATACARARDAPLRGTPVVCVNAWNEWAEGAYLEPDQHFGAAFLNAAMRVLRGATAAAAPEALFVLHDAFPAGAQLLVLHLARAWQRAHGLAPVFLLLGDGALRARFAQLGPVHLAPSLDAVPALARILAARIAACVVGSAAAAGAVPALAEAGLKPVLLVQEMPGLLAARGLAGALRAALPLAQAVVFPAAAARDSVAEYLATDLSAAPLLAQGPYQRLRRNRASGARLRRRLGVPPGARLVLGLGHADHRKGFDLFLALCRASGTDTHCLWCGGEDAAFVAGCADALAAATATGRLHRLAFQPSPAAALNAADCLVLTSREDPYPSVVLEALSLGVPVLGFAGSGGACALLDGEAGRLVPMADVMAMAAALREMPPRVARSLLARGQDFAGYAARLRRLSDARPDVAVAVLCYDQARFVADRLTQVFAQTHPVAGIAVHDDGSADRAMATARATARAAGRAVRLHGARRNSGSPFGRWREAVGAARAELIWLAEADDRAAPEFLSRLVPWFEDPDVVMAFADSVPVDDEGRPAAVDYAAAMATTGLAAEFARDAVFEGRDFAARALSAGNLLFNVSAIVWRRGALLAALDRIGRTLGDWQVAGDWRVAFEVLAMGGRIAHVAAPLNRHRRAATTASARLATSRHLDEIARMQAHIRGILGPDAARDAAQAAHFAAAAAFLHTPPGAPRLSA